MQSLHVIFTKISKIIKFCSCQDERAYINELRRTAVKLLV